MRAASIGGRGVDPRRNVKRDTGVGTVGVNMLDVWSGEFQRSTRAGSEAGRLGFNEERREAQIAHSGQKRTRNRQRN